MGQFFGQLQMRELRVGFHGIEGEKFDNGGLPETVVLNVAVFEEPARYSVRAMSSTVRPLKLRIILDVKLPSHLPGKLIVRDGKWARCGSLWPPQGKTPMIFATMISRPHNAIPVNFSRLPARRSEPWGG